MTRLSLSFVVKEVSTEDTKLTTTSSTAIQFEISDNVTVYLRWTTAKRVVTYRQAGNAVSGMKAYGECGGCKQKEQHCKQRGRWRFVHGNRSCCAMGHKTMVLEFLALSSLF